MREANLAVRQQPNPIAKGRIASIVTKRTASLGPASTHILVVSLRIHYLAGHKGTHEQSNQAETAREPKPRSCA